MNKISSGLLATALSVSFAAAEIVPVNAQPNYVPQGQDLSNVQTVQYQDWRKRRSFSRTPSGMYERNGAVYWNGHRGYREYHRGYRRHGDFWFPLAAFATGALITGAIVNNQNRYADAHVQWCYDHHRSYRASDNTYLSSYGTRRECRSPY